MHLADMVEEFKLFQLDGGGNGDPVQCYAVHSLRIPLAHNRNPSNTLEVSAEFLAED